MGQLPLVVPPPPEVHSLVGAGVLLVGDGDPGGREVDADLLAVSCSFVVLGCVDVDGSICGEGLRAFALFPILYGFIHIP